jgi:hypothetical protein
MDETPGQPTPAMEAWWDARRDTVALITAHVRRDDEAVRAVMACLTEKIITRAVAPLATGMCADPVAARAEEIGRGPRLIPGWLRAGNSRDRFPALP